MSTTGDSDDTICSFTSAVAEVFQVSMTSSTRGTSTSVKESTRGTVISHSMAKDASGCVPAQIS